MLSMICRDDSAGITEARSRTSLAFGESRAARAITESRTDAGTWSSPEARISVTNSGLPSVSRIIESSSAGAPASISATASELRRSSRMRVTSGGASAPMTVRSGWS